MYTYLFLQPALSSLTGLLSLQDVSGDAHSHFVMCNARFELVMNTLFWPWLDPDDSLTRFGTNSAYFELVMNT